MDTSIIYLTLAELAEKAGVTQRQVREHVKEGLLDSTLGEKTGMRYKNHGDTGLVVKQNSCQRLLFTPDQAEAYSDLMRTTPPEDKRKHPEPRQLRKGHKYEEGYNCSLAGRYCGVSDVTIRSAVKAGFLQTIKTNPIKIDEGDLKKYKKALDDRMSLKDASRILQVTCSGIRSMVESGRLERVFKHMGIVYVSRKAVSKMAEEYARTHRAVPDGVQPTMRRLK